MKRVLPLLISLVLTTFSFGQTEVRFEISHMLNDESFELEKQSQNNIGQDFIATRLEYYISGITLIHDGGQSTPLPDKYMLVDATKLTNEPLGMHDITNLEKIEFHIGVDEATNHLDPAQYAPDHPLAPKFPSMHWGWAGGYRFVAYEGFGGKNLNQLFQLHGLGDGNYFKVEVETNVKASNGVLTIPVLANYSAALNDIRVGDGVIVHGESMEAKTCLENFRDHVFTAAQTSSTEKQVFGGAVSIYPNPVGLSVSELTIDIPGNETADIMISNMIGQQIQTIRNISGYNRINLDLTVPGTYILQVLHEGSIIRTEKLTVK